MTRGASVGQREAGLPQVSPVPALKGEVEAWLAAADRVSVASGRPRDAVAGIAEGVVCLDSALSHPETGRWSILGLCPVAEIRGQVGRGFSLRTWRAGAWAPLTEHADPFEALEHLLEPWSGLGAPALGEAPFIGGAIGVFGYGCRASVEDLGALDTPRWGEPDAWWGLYDTFLLVDRHEGSARVVSWGISAWGQAPEKGLAMRRAAAFAEALTQEVEEVAPTEGLGFEPQMAKAAYDAAVSRILEGIGTGQCYQACMTFPMACERPAAVSARSLFSKLRHNSPAPFAALLAPGGSMALAGASPERFLQVRGRAARVRPMKGTRPRGEDEAQDEALRAALAVSTKDRAENVMIVDLMRNDLGRVCELGSVRVPALFTIETYARVHQMTSTITGTLRPEISASAAVRACFPPGSMTGAPKVEAMRLLGGLEIGPRGWYSGVLGHAGFTGDLDLSVIIRSALVSADQIVWHVGGGIVADSTLDGEWREALDKGPLALAERD